MAAVGTTALARSERILLVLDDDRDARFFLKLSDASPAMPMEWIRAGRLDGALELLKSGGVDVILVDLFLPDSTGLDTFKRLYEQVQDIPILVLTGSVDEDIGIQAVHHGAQEYLVKGTVDERALVRAIRYAIERKRTEVQMRKSLREKEVLLREIHHRVKNNLQVISSLLRLGATRVNDPVAKEVFLDSQDRIRSMAMIHETLYRSSDMAHIPVADYLRGLARELFCAHNAYARGIEIDLQVADMDLTVETAIPCGLIVNELVTNSLEHAFPEEARAAEGKAPRWIRVSFRREGAGQLLLRVEDNGVGMPAASERRKGAPSLGLELVATLAGQLRGKLEQVGRPAAACTIMFPERRAR